MRRVLQAVSCMLLLSLGIGTVAAGGTGSRVEYVGGTIAQIPQGCGGHAQITDDEYFVFYSRKASWRVPYDRIDLLEYGLKVDRRYVAAVLISPLFLLSRRRDHFLTIGYTDDDGRRQAMVFRVDKSDIRTILVGLEARTGRKVQYQDEDARRAGKG
ncbi:MAG TPA: hypothetical protein VLT57_08335 [Bryobacteraceae bacterium]|nr:hypothetical protein [Bryobacteraceae bacterium]